MEGVEEDNRSITSSVANGNKYEYIEERKKQLLSMLESGQMDISQYAKEMKKFDIDKFTYGDDENVCQLLFAANLSLRYLYSSLLTSFDFLSL